MSENESAAAPSFLHAGASGFLAGFTGGMVFLAIGLVRHGEDMLRSAPTLAHAIMVCVRSVAIYGILAGIVGVLIAVVLFALTRLLRRGGNLIGPITLGIILAGTVMAYLSAWWQLEVLAGLPFEDAERSSGALRHGALALGVGVLWVLGAALVARLMRSGAQRPPWRATAAVAGVCLLALVVSQVGLRTRAPSGADRPRRPSRVVVLGLDALTFRVMSPMLRAGELPAFQRLIDEGAWGTFLTYGQASSPMVWTSMATGKRVRDHGINDFVTKRPGSYSAEPMKSFDWRARPVWEIVNDFGRRASVVDWLISFPPREIDGAMVTRLHMDEVNRTFPPELNADVNAILADVRDYGDADRTKNFSQIDHVFATTELLMEGEWSDLVCAFEGVSDWVEHRYWKFYEPDHYDRQLWGFSDSEVDQFDTMIPETYAHLDRKLGEFMDRLDEDTLLMVVSDHGQLASPQRPVWMRMDRVLEALGFVTLTDGADGKPAADHTLSRAYASVETPWAPLIGVNVNRIGREPTGIVPEDEAPGLETEIVRALRAIVFEDGTPVFGAVYPTGGRDDGTSAGKADIVVTHSRFTRSDRYSQRSITVGDRSFRLNDFMEADTNISGGHDHQGVIFLHGPGVRRGPIGQQVVSTALQEIIWHVTDKIDAVDQLLPLMKKLGLIERATTLDLTPTILHAFGLPVAADMAGRALADLVVTGEPVETILTYETGESGIVRPVDGESDEDMLKRLKALGYIN